VSRELLLDNLFQIAMALSVLVLVRNGADLAVTAVGQDGAHSQLVGADAAFGGVVEGVNVGFDVLGEHGRAVFLARAGEDHREEALRLEGEIAADVGLEGAVVFGLVGVFDGVDVGVGAPDQHVVEPVLFGASALKGVFESLYIVLEGSPKNGEETLLEVAGCFGLDVILKNATLAVLICWVGRY